MINIETGAGRLTLSIGAQHVPLYREDTANLADLAAGPDGTDWSQAVYRIADGSTVFLHRHGGDITLATGLDGQYAAAQTTAATLTRTMREVTPAGDR